MTVSNDTHEDVYNQILKVERYMSAFKDVYENMPVTDAYSSVFSILGEGMEKDLKTLCSMALAGKK
jgi:hypothetical protein